MALIDNLLAYYKLDETSGTTVIDSTGNTNGTNSSATVNQTGKIGTSYSFNGSTSYVKIPDILNSTTSFTVAMWVKSNTTSGDSYVTLIGNLHTSWSSGDWMIYDDGNNIKSYLVDTTNTSHYISKSSILDNNWHFVIIKYDGSILYIYIDDIVNSVDVPNNIPVSSNSLYIGRKGNAANYFEGLIDEVGIWNRALTQAEVSELYNSGAGLTYPFIPTQTILEKAWYKLNETSGTTAIDSSGNGYTGTVHSGTIGATGKIDKAYQTTANSHYIQLPSGLNSIGEGSFSISLWAKISTNGRLVVKDENANNGSWAVAISGSNYFYSFYRGASTVVSDSGVNIVDNTWHHLVLTRNPSTGNRKLYIDNVLKHTLTGDTYTSSNNEEICIGSESSSADEYPCGSVGYYDDVRIYDFALSESDISLIYNNGNGTEVDLYTLRNPPTPTQHNFFSMSLGAEF